MRSARYRKRFRVFTKRFLLWPGVRVTHRGICFSMGSGWDFLVLVTTEKPLHEDEAVHTQEV